MITTIALVIVAFVCNWVIGVFALRYTIGEGIGIIIGDGMPFWILYVAIILWPLAVLWWLWLCYGPGARS